MKQNWHEPADREEPESALKIEIGRQYRFLEENVPKLPRNNPRKRQIIAPKRHIINPTWRDSPPTCS